MAITKIYKGSQELENVVRIYKGSELLWEKQSGEPTETIIEFTLPSSESFYLAFTKDDELPITISYDDGTSQTLTGSGYKSTSSKSFSAGEHTISISGEGKYSFDSYIMNNSIRNSYITSLILSNKVTALKSSFAINTNLSTLIIPSSVLDISPTAFGALYAPSYTSNFSSFIVHPNNPVYCSIDNIIYSKDKTILVRCATKNVLSMVNIDNATTTINNFAFFQCSNVSSISLNNKVTTLPTGFCAYSSLETITIPNSVINIDSSAFSNCSNLSNVTFEENSSLTTIGLDAFLNCTSLGNINVPASVVSIRNTSFDNTLWYNNQPDGVVYVNQFLYRYKGTAPASTSITVASGTTEICSSAFSGQTGIISVSLPDTLKIIGNSAFANSGLATITIPSSVTTIGTPGGGGSFRGTKLTTITIPSSITRIEASTFRDSLIGTAILPSTITYIGEDAFWTKVKRTIICNAITPPTLAEHWYTFGEVYADGGATIKVPSASVSTYKSAFGWSWYAAVISAK
jgi:hypothetical protein